MPAHLSRAVHEEGANHLVDVYRFGEHSTPEAFAKYGRTLVHDHYLEPDEIIRFLEKYDLPQLVKAINDRIPEHGSVRTGDVAEMLAVDYVEKALQLNVPIRKFRYRSSRNVAMFGDDALALAIEDGCLVILRVEAKNYESISLQKLQDIYDTLAADDYMPSADTLTFTARRVGDERIRDAVEELQARINLDAAKISLLMFVVYERPHSEQNVTALCATRARWPFLAAVGVCLPERSRLETMIFDAALVAEELPNE